MLTVVRPLGEEGIQEARSLASEYGRRVVALGVDAIPLSSTRGERSVFLGDGMVWHASRMSARKAVVDACVSALPDLAPKLLDNADEVRVESALLRASAVSRWLASVPALRTLTVSAELAVQGLHLPRHVRHVRVVRTRHQRLPRFLSWTSWLRRLDVDSVVLVGLGLDAGTAEALERVPRIEVFPTRYARVTRAARRALGSRLAVRSFQV